MKQKRRVDSTYPCLFLRFVNDGRYLPGDMSKNVQQGKSPRQNNFYFVQMSFQGSAFELKDLFMVAARVLLYVVK